jgi:hypothetical protein
MHCIMYFLMFPTYLFFPLGDALLTLNQSLEWEVHNLHYLKMTWDRTNTRMFIGLKI